MFSSFHRLFWFSLSQMSVCPSLYTNEFKLIPLTSRKLLIFTTQWINSADDQLMTFFPEKKRILHFMQIISCRTYPTDSSQGFNFYRCMGKFRRRRFEHIFLIFPRKQNLTFHANCLRRQFAWNAVKSYFLGQKKKKKKKSKCRLMIFLSSMPSII